MNATDLTRCLTLEYSQRVPDGAGGFVESWIALGELWAALDARSGRAEVAAGGLRAGAMPYRITVRSAPVGSEQRPRIGQRFREGQRVFRIIAVADDDPRGMFLTCHAREEMLG